MQYSAACTTPTCVFPYTYCKLRRRFPAASYFATRASSPPPPVSTFSRKICLTRTCCPIEEFIVCKALLVLGGFGDPLRSLPQGMKRNWSRFHDCRGEVTTCKWQQLLPRARKHFCFVGRGQTSMSSFALRTQRAVQMLDDMLILANFVYWLTLSRSERHVLLSLLCAGLIGCAVLCCAAMCLR